MKRTAELTGAELDHYVALALGADPAADIGKNQGKTGFGLKVREGKFLIVTPGGIATKWRPSTDWATGGPIVEREAIATMPCFEDGRSYWTAAHPKVIKGIHGPTPLTAAMRALVTATLGAEVPE